LFFPLFCSKTFEIKKFGVFFLFTFSDNKFVECVNTAEDTGSDPCSIFAVGRVVDVDVLLGGRDHLDFFAQPLTKVGRHAHAARHHNLGEHFPADFLVQLQNRVENAALDAAVVQLQFLLQHRRYLVFVLLLLGRVEDLFVHVNQFVLQDYFGLVRQGHDFRQYLSIGDRIFGFVIVQGNEEVFLPHFGDVGLLVRLVVFRIHFG